MTSNTFRKTLLALAVTGAALPAYAQTLTLTNAGIAEQNSSYSETVEIGGSFTGAKDAVALDSVDIDGSLILAASIKASGEDADGLDLTQACDEAEASCGAPVQISGDLLNKGSIEVEGAGSSALNIDPAQIGGSLVNQGTLSVKGEPQVEEDGEVESVSAISLYGTEIGGDLLNDTSGKIIAEGTQADGIEVLGSSIGGKMINSGLIQVSGQYANAINLEDDSYYDGLSDVNVPTYVPSIENTGSIVARGEGADGIDIDGAVIDSIVNSGSIQADGIAIEIEEFQLTPEAEAAGEFGLRLVQNGGLISGGEAAINANGGDVGLDWNGGKIQGDILGLNNDVSVDGNAVFDGARIEAWAVEVGEYYDAVGHLELLQSHTTIDGNFWLSAGSSLGLNLGSATDPNQAVLSVTGGVELESGTQIKLTAQDSDFSPQGSRYTLIEAGGFIDVDDEAPFQVVSNSAWLNVDSFAIEGNTLVSTVSVKTAEQIAEAIGESGASENAQQAAGSFVTVMQQLSGSNPDDPVYQAFKDADTAEFAELAEELTPEVNGGATQAATTGQSLVSNVTSNRTSGGRGLSSGEAFQETGVWAQALYSDANQDMRDGVAGYNVYSSGIAIGADGKLSDELTLGLAYSFINSDVNGDTGNSTEVDSHLFTLYSGYEYGNYFVDGSLTYGASDNSGERHVAGTRAEGDYDSDLLGLNLVGGYAYHLSDGLLIEPRLAARYSNVQIDSYQEKGSSAALSVEDQRYEIAELGAGLRVAGSYLLGQGRLEPQAKLMAYHDFAQDQASSASTFVLGGTPFVTAGAKPESDSYEAGVGVDYLLGAFTLGATYDYYTKTDFNADTFTAKVRYDF